jgi:ribosomal protein L11 methyltransferase
VLDYGCGSGILAIAASRLGASEVIGTDIDPQALLVARANSTLNHAAARYTDPEDRPPGAFDLVLANILTNPLKVLARLLLARVALNGHLVLSGVLAHQASELIGWYSDLDPGLSLAVGETDDGWVCLAGTRR